MTRKYLKLEIEIQVSSISESSGKKNKIMRLFFGRSYGSTILFRDLLTIRIKIFYGGMIFFTDYNFQFIFVNGNISNKG